MELIIICFSTNQLKAGVMNENGAGLKIRFQVFLNIWMCCRPKELNLRGVRTEVASSKIWAYPTFNLRRFCIFFTRPEARSPTCPKLSLLSPIQLITASLYYPEAKLLNCILAVHQPFAHSLLLGKGAPREFTSKFLIPSPHPSVQVSH